MKTLRFDNIWNFATFKLYTVDFKNSTPTKVFNRFSKSLPELEDVDGGHLGGKFQVRRYFTFAMQGEKFAHRKHLKFCHFQPVVHCASKNPISTKVFKTIFEIFASARRCWGWAFGWKVSGAQVFYFCNARWKLCASTTFEILPLSTCTLCQQKSYTSKGIQPIFEIFAWARRCWGWAFGWKVSGAQVFYFCNANVKTLDIDNIWNFATFNFYTVPAKILYLQRYSTDFRNLRLSSKMLSVGIWVESFRCAGILLLQWQDENFGCIDNIWNFATFNLFTVQQKSHISKGIQPIFEIFASARRCLGWAFGWKVCRCAGVLLLQWQGEKFAHRQHLKFCRFQPVHCASKNPISPKVFNRFSKSSASARRCWGWAFGWKVLGAQIFYFCNGKVKTLRIDNIWNFATFNLYTVPAKILHLQRYSTDFRNLCLSSKMLRVVHLGGKFQVRRYFTFAMQGENFAHRKHLKFCHFQPVHCA